MHETAIMVRLISKLIRVCFEFEARSKLKEYGHPTKLLDLIKCMNNFCQVDMNQKETEAKNIVQISYEYSQMQKVTREKRDKQV